MINIKKEVLILWLFGFFLWWFLLIPFEYNLFGQLVKLIQLPFYSLLRYFDKSLQFESDTFGMYLLVGISAILASFSFPLLRKIVSKSKYSISTLLSTFLIGCLILFLLKYGIIKLFKTQFYLPEPNTVYTSFGKLSKDIAYWSIIRSSDIYNRISGLVEILCAFLLYFRKTRLLGGLLACFIFANVFLVNISFDISVKLFSFSLLISSIIVLILQPKFLLLINKNPKSSTLERVVSKKGTLVFLLIVLIECLSPSILFLFHKEDKNSIEKFVGAYEIENHPKLKRFYVNSQYYLIFETKNSEMMDWKVLSIKGKVWNLKHQNKVISFQWNKKTLNSYNQKIVFHPLVYKKLPLLQNDIHFFSDEYH